MNSEKTITLDNVTMHRAADGTVTIAPKKGGGCVNIGLLIASGIVTLGGLAMSASEVFQLFSPGGKFDFGVVVFGLFVTAMFGGFAFYLYSRMRAGGRQEGITILPIMNMVKFGDRVVPFDDIVNVLAEESPAVIEGASIATFLLVLSEGNTVELGQIAAETEKLEKRKTEVISLLKVALKKS